MSLSAGYALWVPVGVRHRFTVHANSVTMPLFFDSASTATTPREPTLVSVDDDLRTLMLAHSVSFRSAITPEASVSGQLLSLIERSRAVATAVPLPETGAARSIAQALQFNPGDIRTAEELADSVHASLRTVERAFLCETGMTLREWRIRSRMEAAAALLRAYTTVDAVAYQVGYTHVNAFRRVFKQHLGITPTEYVRRYGKR